MRLNCSCPEKSITTKGTNVHKGKSRGFPSCSFLSFVVEALPQALALATGFAYSTNMQSP
jgi:hypothetical protein